MVVPGENRRLTTSYWHLSRDSNPAIGGQLSLVEEMVVPGENRRLTTSYWHLSLDLNPAIGVVSCHWWRKW